MKAVSYVPEDQHVDVHSEEYAAKYSPDGGQADYGEHSTAAWLCEGDETRAGFDKNNEI